MGKFGLVIAVAFAFILGMVGTVYLSLRSPEVRVPEVVNQNRWNAEKALDKAGLHMRVRATRFVRGTQPDTVLNQSPQPGEVVKFGQTVALVVSRGPDKDEEAAAAAFTAAEAEAARQKSAEEDEDAKNKNANKNTNEKSAKNRNANRNKNSNNANANTANRNANNSNANKNANNTNRNPNTMTGGNRNANTNKNTQNANRRLIINPTTQGTPARPPQ